MATIIDLRSDTVTQPSPQMRKAMAAAKVGDDYYHEDVTVKRLEALAAEMLGKEAGLFVSSGTMGNLVSLMTHTRRGEAILLEENSHIYHNENGGCATIAGVLARPLKSRHGILDAMTIAGAVTGSEVLHPRTSLICIENTHNVAGGTCWTLEEMKKLRAVANKYQLAIHVDGARIFNAAVALRVKPARIVSEADSITFCLSKGLACPFGSLICGTEEFIAEARRNRQMVGGGMRQAGIMAAAGVVALETMVDRLAEDHENAKLLASGLAELGFEIDQKTVQSNMVYARVPSSFKKSGKDFVEKLRKRAVWVNPPRKEPIRFVTHYGLEKSDIKRALAAIKESLKN
jgi:threonine aldolase